MPQDDSWWPETNGHDIGSQLVSQLESVEDTVKSRLYGTQDDEQKDIEVGVEGKKFKKGHYMYHISVNKFLPSIVSSLQHFFRQLLNV